jgi:hypothetical protein
MQNETNLRPALCRLCMALFGIDLISIFNIKLLANRVTKHKFVIFLFPIFLVPMAGCEDQAQLKAHLEKLEKENASKNLSKHPESVELRSRLWKRVDGVEVPLFPDDWVYHRVEYNGNPRYWIGKRQLNFFNYTIYDPKKVGTVATKLIDDELPDYGGLGGAFHLPDYSGFKAGGFPPYFDENRVSFNIRPLANETNESWITHIRNGARILEFLPLKSENSIPFQDYKGEIVIKGLACYRDSTGRREFGLFDLCFLRTRDDGIAIVKINQYDPIGRDPGNPFTLMEFYSSQHGGALFMIEFHSKHIANLIEIEDFVRSKLDLMLVKNNSAQVKVVR